MELDQANDRIGNLLDFIAALEQALGEDAWCFHEWTQRDAHNMIEFRGEPLVRRLVSVMYKTIDKIDGMAEVLWQDEYTIPCSLCGKPVYDNADAAHVATGKIDCEVK